MGNLIEITLKLTGKAMCLDKGLRNGSWSHTWRHLPQQTNKQSDLTVIVVPYQALTWAVLKDSALSVLGMKSVALWDVKYRDIVKKDRMWLSSKHISSGKSIITERNTLFISAGTIMATDMLLLYTHMLTIKQNFKHLNIWSDAHIPCSLKLMITVRQIVAHKLDNIDSIVTSRAFTVQWYLVHQFIHDIELQTGD